MPRIVTLDHTVTLDTDYELLVTNSSLPQWNAVSLTSESALFGKKAGFARSYVFSGADGAVEFGRRLPPFRTTTNASVGREPPAAREAVFRILAHKSRRAA